MPASVDLLVGNSFGFAAWRGEAGAMSSAHAHNDIEINLCAGELVYRAGGIVRRLPPGSPCAFWGARPHRLVHIDEGAELAWVTVPLDRFVSWRLPRAVKQALLQGSVLVGDAARGLEALSAQIGEWSRDLADVDSAAGRAAALEVEALLLRMSLGTWAEEPAESGAASARPSRQVERATRMAEYIAENAGAPIRVADVAAVVHLHPNRAAADFRAVLGSGIPAYLAQVRVAEAQRLLATTELPTAAVGAAAGFRSASSFHETFARVCGVSPGTWRRLHAEEG